MRLPKKESNSSLIPYGGFSKVIIHYLASNKHTTYHRRPDLLFITLEMYFYIIGNLKFILKVSQLKCLEWAIPDPDNSKTIQQSSYYPKYLKWLLENTKKTPQGSASMQPATKRATPKKPTTTTPVKQTKPAPPPTKKTFQQRNRTTDQFILARRCQSPPDFFNWVPLLDPDDDTSEKIDRRKYSALHGPEVYKNQESEKSPKEIIKAKKEHGEEKQDSTYSIRSTDEVDIEEFDLKSALFSHMNKKKSANKNTTNYRLYHALMEALIADEDAMDKEVADKVKDHKRKHDSDDDDEDDDDDEGPSAGSNQGRSTKRRRSDSAASGSAKTSRKDDGPKLKEPRESEASASKQHPTSFLNWMADTGHLRG
ncbi:hypothetical protein Tco_0748264 [Tanacetum coccineum]|uniref:Uncharacterized protein n=1 Tax=Tanacetum coccineum TaxID=301880 RepID=A0ABQ4YY39_9ASTR